MSQVSSRGVWPSCQHWDLSRCPRIADGRVSLHDLRPPDMLRPGALRAFEGTLLLRSLKRVQGVPSHKAFLPLFRIPAWTVLGGRRGPRFVITTAGAFCPGARPVTARGRRARTFSANSALWTRSWPSGNRCRHSANSGDAFSFGLRLQLPGFGTCCTGTTRSRCHGMLRSRQTVRHNHGRLPNRATESIMDGSVPG